MSKKWKNISLIEKYMSDSPDEIELSTNNTGTFKTITKTIEFDAKTKIIELDKIIKEADEKSKFLPNRAKVSKALELLKPLERSKNPKAKERVREIMEILESVLAS